MLTVALTPDAENDLDELIDYTVEHFGSLQLIKYRNGLSETIENICRYPMMGSSVGHIRPDTRRMQYKAHSIYYEVHPDYILVVRILGPGRDLLLAFE